MLPQLPFLTPGPDEVLVLTNADLRESANLACWPVQEKYEGLLAKALAALGKTARRAHPVKAHGFISGQREGADVLASLDPDAPLIVLLTAWQYSHHIAAALVTHRGPVLLLANFDGTWPGLVGMLNMAGSLTAMGRPYARLWSAGFDDAFFRDGLKEWLDTGAIAHDLSHLREITEVAGEGGRLGAEIGTWSLRHKEIIGLFDMVCMGMLNGTFPLQAMSRIGMPIEALSQSDLLVEMAEVPDSLREACLQWYEAQGMTFRFDETFTRAQVKEQCAMMIAMARYVDRFGLSAVGVQYQQGLARCCAASDFAEGAIGSSARFPIPTPDGRIIRPGKPIPHANEVDMGSAIPQVLMFRLLDTLGLPSETTLHDVRWGSDWQGDFVWDFEISGAVPFEHLKGGIAGATGYRQPAMYFPKGGSTIAGQGKAGRLLWARAHYEGVEVFLHAGLGRAIELPAEEWERRRRATSYEWPLLNATLDGVSRDQLMAGHQSNHIAVAYVPEERAEFLRDALCAQALAQNIRVIRAGS